MASLAVSAAAVGMTSSQRGAGGSTLRRIGRWGGPAWTGCGRWLVRSEAGVPCRLLRGRLIRGWGLCGESVNILPMEHCLHCGGELMIIVAVLE